MSEVEMTHEQAIAELETAVKEDAIVEQSEAPAPAPPVGAPEENDPGVQPPAQSEDTVPVPFNPDDLPEELLPAWKQLQSAWTPKLQEAAAIQRQYEQYGGAEAVAQAAQLYARIADPEQWPALYEELSDAMSQYGYEFESSEQAPPGAPSADFGNLDPEDPDLAPIIGRLQQLEGTTQAQQNALEQFYQHQESVQAVADEELYQAQHLAQLQRQVVSIRQANPNYDDEDIKDIVRMAPFFNDDLALAHSAFEQSFARRMDRYYAGKQSAGAASHGAPQGAGVTSVTGDNVEATLQEVEDEAVAYLRGLQAAGELDL